MMIVNIPVLIVALLASQSLGFAPPKPSLKAPTALFSTASEQASESATAAAAGPKIRKIALFGGGTVGGGIVDILESKRSHILELTGSGFQISQIIVKDASKLRDFPIPDGCTVTDTTEWDSILQDPEIDMVVEVMGGTDDAKRVVFEALKHGKDVVTANKALIAKHLTDIQNVLAENPPLKPDGTPVQFRFEAAVCGGIPVIRSMQSDFVGDDIEMLSGIINGCTNFMLTAMDQGGKTYDEALAEASRLGYAEADPTLDVGGFDARSKLCILMRLAYGVQVDEEQIACRGITELTKLDFEYAKMMGGTIKLIGVAKKVSDDKVAAFVSPCYVTNSDSLATVNGATNAIEVLSKNLVSSTYIGQGAGRYPTANSCVNDIVSLMKGDMTPLPFNPLKANKQFVNDYESDFFIRLKYRDQVGITRQCGEICEKHHVSIHSILQNPVTRRDDAAFVLITEKVPLKQVQAVVADLQQLDWAIGEIFYMPVLTEDWVGAMASP